MLNLATNLQKKNIETKILKKLPFPCFSSSVQWVWLELEKKHIKISW